MNLTHTVNAEVKKLSKRLHITVPQLLSLVKVNQSVTTDDLQKAVTTTNAKVPQHDRHRRPVMVEDCIDVDKTYERNRFKRISER